MKIASIRFSGFRGARGEVALELPTGFLVVLGRNGTGKSTICDAIEFALTGVIRASSQHTEKGESIAHYVWWKGAGHSTKQFVELTLVNDAGTRFVISRTPEALITPPGIRLEDLLCSPDTSLVNPLSQICRSAILRDEEITQLSVDLKESERFDLVREVLGTADFAQAEAKAKEVTDLLRLEESRAAVEYGHARERDADLTSRLSQARAEAAKAGDVASAEAFIAKLEPIIEPALPVENAERHLAKTRQRADALSRLYTKLQAVSTRIALASSLKTEQEYQLLSTQLEQARSTLSRYEKENIALSESLAKVQLESPRIASIALLHQHGSRLGLIKGGCPLCGTTVAPEQFAAQLLTLDKTAVESNHLLSSLTKQAADIAVKLAKARAEASSLAARVSLLKQAQEEVRAELATLRREAEALSYDIGSGESLRIEPLRDVIERDRLQALAIESAIGVIYSSRSLQLVYELEKELTATRESLTLSEQRNTRVQTAFHRMREASATIKRVQGEMIDERLAQLEPLLEELYQRLRPHIDWTDFRYRLRGDVRKMLRFEVGESLNPSFVFSSGQRRAAGLAFLLALHLSRGWCKLNTLVLDDPVQHIDDYRALHLTEVLASIRGIGRQVICTVEDVALANLLARRLKSERESGGKIVRMTYSSTDGIAIESEKTIYPMPRNLLVTAS